MVASEDETQQKGLFGLAKGFPTILGKNLLSVSHIMA